MSDHPAQEPTDSPPKIEFPCDYPIKIIGLNGASFSEAVIEVVRIHAPGFDEATIELHPSRNGTYVSVNVVIEATSEAQLKLMHADLMSIAQVKMVL